MRFFPALDTWDAFHRMSPAFTYFYHSHTAKAGVMSSTPKMGKLRLREVQ
jgi:hypothetical protein